MGDAKLGLRAPQAPTCNIHHVPKTWKLRGSGLWGPEQTDVLKLILWNRKRQWRPQREVPTIEEQQDHYVLEFAIIWFTAGNIFIMGPVLWWAKKYRMALFLSNFCGSSSERGIARTFCFFWERRADRHRLSILQPAWRCRLLHQGCTIGVRPMR